MDPTTMIPEAWRAWLALAVTYAFAAFAVTTIAVHRLLPIAQRIEQWAIASSVTWDNKPARKLVEVLAWLCGLTDLLWALPRFTMGRSPDPERREERSKLNGARPPDSGVLALALVIIAAACAAATSGCGAGALGAQADLVTGAAIVWTEADTALVQMRAHDLDAVVDAAREECGEGTCTEERRAYWRAQLAATEARWEPAMECRGTVPASLRSWVDGIDTARAAQSDELRLALFARLGGRFALDYAAFARCVDAAVPDHPPLPELSADLEALAASFSTSTNTARTAGGEAGVE